MRLRRQAKAAHGADLRYVTVVTYGRTGSTALQAALNALPGVLVRGENYSAFRGLNAYLQAIAETADRHRGGKPTHPWFGAKRIRPSAVLEDLRRHVVVNVLRPEAGTEWVGFKEVRYEPGHFPTYDDLLNYLLFLDKLFPDLRYLMNVREPEDVARSGWWPGNDNALEVLGTTRQWLLDSVADLNAILGSGHATAVDYAGWSADPQVVIDAFASLGLPAMTMRSARP